VPRRIKIAWTAALMLIGASFAGMALIGAFFAPSGYTGILLGTMTVGILALSTIQYLVRREVMGRLDSEQEQHAAQKIQSRLLPSSLPTMAGVDLAGHYSPFKLVGGDFYDARPLGESQLLIAMADVSGKGSAAALLTANLQALLHFSHLREQPPDAVVRSINEHLVRHTEVSRFVTMVLAVFDLRTRRLRYVNAGHNPPLGVTAAGETLRLDATGPAMGWFDTAEYGCSEVDVPVGATLLFYTDGLSERANVADDQFGATRIITSLRDTSGQPATQVLETVVTSADRFAGGVQAEDDAALLVLRST
jgi:sigma-B regulation protein RsbU (phosphoserine phosphatase)